MQDLARLELALRNADAAGDEAAARVLVQAIRAAQAGKTAPPAPSAGERIATGMADPVHGGAQLLTRALPDSVVRAGNAANNWLADKTGLVPRLPEGGVDEAVRAREAAYQSRRGTDPGTDWYRTLGNVLSPVNVGLGGAGVGATGTSLLARSVGGAALGGGAAALAPVTSGDYWGEKSAQVGAGAALGALTPAVVQGVSRVISPKASTNPHIELLRKEGVYPTAGQTLGGAASRAEEKLQSVPITGDAISAARQRALVQLNRAVINRATSPIGVTVDEVGHEGIKKAGNALSQAYDDVLQSLQVVRFDGAWRNDYGQLKTMAKALPQGVRSSFSTKTKALIDDRIRTGVMTAETMKQLDSELGALARRYSGSSVASEQELGTAYLQAQALLRAQVGRNSPAAAAAMGKINEGWANLVRVEGAGKAAMNNEGLFTPAQLNQAIRAAESGARKRAISRGEALMQDLGTAGQQVLGGRTANSGTVDRALLASGALGTWFLNPAIPTGLVAGAAAYTPPAQALLRGAVSSRPGFAQPVAGALNKASPMLAPAGGLLGVEMLNQ